MLIGILERAELSGPELARTHLWIAETTVGIVMQEAALPLPEQIASARASLAEMAGEARERLAPLLPHLARLDGAAFFAFVADRVVEAVVSRAGRGAAGRRGRRPATNHLAQTRGRRV